MKIIKSLLLLFMFFEGFQVGFGVTDRRDADALRSLMDQWQNTPPNWGDSNDPCGEPWVGVVCENSRVTVLRLPSMGIEGTLSGDIGQLTKLQSLILSSNAKLGGSLTKNIGNLVLLDTLILSGCSFSGNIPQELGNLPLLSFLALNSNKFTGKIPPSLGQLSNLSWFDIADNQLSGTIPISNDNSPGLDQLHKAEHFHFNKNQLSGTISEKLFSSKMQLLHVLFDANEFTGKIPASIGLVKSIKVLRLDRNSFSGTVPSSISNLTSVNELNLASNKLSGPMPDLTGMNSLNYVDLSNNAFDASEAPAWFSTIQSLAVLIVESGGLHGNIPETMFSLPGLEQVLLDNNRFNGSINLGDKFSLQLQLVNFQNNSIISIAPSQTYNETLILVDNPVCNNQQANPVYCTIQQSRHPSYSTSTEICGSKACPSDQSLNPQSCNCAYPYDGAMIFRAPSFRDLTNSSLFQSLGSSLSTKLNLTEGSVFLANPYFNSNDYLQIQVKLFPSSGMYFSREDISRIGGDLSSQSYKPPPIFGPYLFIASPYPFQGSDTKGSSISKGAVIGITIGCIFLIIGLVALGYYAFKQKKNAEKAMVLTQPFASWGSGGKDTGGAPQLKGSRWFSFEEVNKCTNNFSEANEIGSGGYGKVYKGILFNGQMVAIKRADKGSTQGGHEFKTEIELLSRVHHKNLVDLIGFCFDQGEQMLVYEFVPKGTLRENLTGGRGRLLLDWKRRLRIALGSARGLAYLHELANPPIIHRDIKTTNILLDENLNAKVADFGLSKLVIDTDANKGHVSTQVKGTLGYLDPEYYMTQQLTEKSDVYSFGVVMLELITSKQPIEKGKYIVREVRMAMNELDAEHYGLKDLIDPSIRNTNLIGFKRFVDLAMQCVEEAASSRPTMNELVKEIEVMLQNEGLFSNSVSNFSSTTSSATDFVNKKGVTDPYNATVVSNNDGSSAFEYSGSQPFVPKVEPK